MVELKGVSKSYSGQRALGPLDLKLESNRVTALIGPSGCGKSTLLRVILGLIEPDEGSVIVEGCKMGPEAAMDIRRGIGYVVQDGGLFPHLSAARNVSLMALYLGQEPGRVQARVDELCRLTHVDKTLMDRYPAELSGGQRQRVGLMRALALDPELLLLDEPLGALDPLVRAGLQDDLKEIFRTRGKTVVFVTHDMGEAAYLADHIVLLRAGVVVQEGTFEDIQREPADEFVKAFLSAQRQVGAIA